MATTIAHHATVKVLGLDLTPFQESIAVFEKNSEKDDDDDDELKMERKNIVGTVNSVIVGPVCSANGKDLHFNLAYNCGKLAVATVNAVHEICKEWKLNMPALRKSKNSYEVYVHSEQNTRKRMEDKHIVITEFNNLFGLDKVDFVNNVFNKFKPWNIAKANQLIISYLGLPKSSILCCV